MDEKQLLELKQEIDDAKSKISELTGTKNQLIKDLEERWDCKTLAEAEKSHKKLADEIRTLSDKIDKGVKELNEKYEL